MATTNNNLSCPECNVTNLTDSTQVRHPWVAEEFIGRNYTIDEVNSVVMLRNMAGIVYLGICIVIGTIGNCHVILVFSKRTYSSKINVVQQRIHVNYRIFILWLSILGLVSCVVVAPLLIVYLVYTVTYPSELLCKIFRFILYFIPVTMNLTYISIAIDRYFVICRTFQNKLTERHSLLMCLATVIISVILTWPAPILFGRGQTKTGIPGLIGYRCYKGDGDSELTLKLQNYFQAILVVFFFVVLIVLFILYTKVKNTYRGMLRFRRTSRRYSASTPEAFKQEQEKQEKQRLWIYGSVTIGYVICALPYHILSMLWFAKVINDCDLPLPEAQGFYLFIWSYFLSPVLNPFIYGFQDDGFRNSVKAFYHSYRRVSLKKHLFERSSGDTSSETNSDNIPFKQGLGNIAVENTANVVTADIKPGSELDGVLSDIASTTLDIGGLVISATGLEPSNQV